MFHAQHANFLLLRLIDLHGTHFGVHHLPGRMVIFFAARLCGKKYDPVCDRGHIYTLFTLCFKVDVWANFPGILLHYCTRCTGSSTEKYDFGHIS